MLVSQNGHIDEVNRLLESKQIDDNVQIQVGENSDIYPSEKTSLKKLKTDYSIKKKQKNVFSSSLAYPSRHTRNNKKTLICCLSFPLPRHARLLFFLRMKMQK